MCYTNKKLVIWGASGHALVVADIIRLSGEYEIVGFLDDLKPERRGEHFCGAAILGGKEQLDLLRSKGVEYILFGFGNCSQRLALSKIVTSKGFTLAKAMHLRAIASSDVTISAGSVVVGGAVINAGSHIGENVIINTCASFDQKTSK